MSPQGGTLMPLVLKHCIIQCKTNTHAVMVTNWIAYKLFCIRCQTVLNVLITMFTA